MTKSLIAVLDHGSGNLRSIARALQAVGAAVTITNEKADCEAVAGLVIPGVGAFDQCVRGIREIDCAEMIRKRVAQRRSTLGICVGMQILFTEGIEHGEQSAGLALWPGSVRRLQAPVVPHMGWNTVKVPSRSQLFRGVEQERFYFVHSYAAFPNADLWGEKDGARPHAEVSTCEYGDEFIAAVEEDALSATQFHPEKSGDAGLTLLENWVKGLA